MTAFGWVGDERIRPRGGGLQDLVLGAEVLDDFLLLPVDQAGQDSEEEQPRKACGRVGPRLSLLTLRGVGPRLNFLTLRARVAHCALQTLPTLSE